MKLLNRFPRWLQFSGLAAFTALCVGVNAIALVEISRSLRSGSSGSIASLPETNTIKITPVEPAAAVSSTEQAQESASNTSEAATASRLASTAPLSTNKNITLSKSPDSDFAQSTEPFISTTDRPSEQVRPKQKAEAQPKYGHFPHTASNVEEMIQVASYSEGTTQRAEHMHPEAAKALLDMVAAARADGVWLVPASGFRTFAQQRTLFNAQVAKRGSPEAAAKTSAPPGYSEHHTGYAIDLTDGTFAQNQDISSAFATSPAYQWLVENAVNYGFELSFPENNPQGVAFEPWHWRYVGSSQARRTFGKTPQSNTVSGGTERILE